MKNMDIQAYVARYKSSGETNVMGFCKREGISYHRFKYYWIRSGHWTKTRKQSGFVTIAVQEKAVTASSRKSGVQSVVARLFANDELRLEVQGEFTAGFLRELAGC